MSITAYGWRAALLLFLTGLPAWTLASAHGTLRPITEVAQGELKGIRDRGINVFEGVPYAAPPIGERRWRPPAPPVRWQGTRDADAFGPSCVQPAVPKTSVYFDPPAATSEDCLTLNVWAPAKAHAAPVIVYIYGGSLRIGGSAEPLYDGTNFARRGVAFVSFNYRMGVLGWLAHPALTEESPDHASGNYGLLDQIAALQWVRKNIAAFGGDPQNVTVMGESAGALSVTYLLSSPLARGLFDKALMESANTRAVPELERTAFGLPSAERTGAELAEKLGAPTLANLRAMDAQTLTDRAAAAGFTPQGTVDGWALPREVVDVFDAGEQVKVPLLAGFNSGELRSQRGFLPPSPKDASAYEAAIRQRYGDLAPEFLRLYPSSDIGEGMLATLRDAIYGWATERMVRKQSAAGVPAYLYLFDHCDAASRARDLCAFHASELPYVFGQVGKEAKLPPNWPRPAGGTDAALSNAMVDYWVAFAKTGRPDPAGLPVWKPFSQSGAFMHFTDRPVASVNPLPGMFAMQEELVRRRRAAGEQFFVNVGVAATPVPER